jgi:hypothetical protein
MTNPPIPLKEVVARAIARKNYGFGDTDPIIQQWVDSNWQDYLGDADAAIAAYRQHDPERKALVEALRALVNNINEFGQVTDPEFIDQADTALAMPSSLGDR